MVVDYNELLHDKEKIFNQFFLPNMDKQLNLFNEIVSWLKNKHKDILYFDEDIIGKINKYPKNKRDEFIDYLNAYVIVYFIVLPYKIPYDGIDIFSFRNLFKIDGLYPKVVNGLVSKLKKIHSYSLIYLYYVFQTDTEFAKKIEREIILRPPREIDIDVFNSITSLEIYKLVRMKYQKDKIFGCYYHIDRHPDYDVLEDNIVKGSLNYIFIPTKWNSLGRYKYSQALLHKYRLNEMNENGLYSYKQKYGGIEVTNIYSSD